MIRPIRTQQERFIILNDDAQFARNSRGES